MTAERITERNEAFAIGTTTMEYFFAPNFAEINNEPVYDELADLLETVRASGKYSRIGFGIETHGFITGDIKSVLHNQNLLSPELDLPFGLHLLSSP